MKHILTHLHAIVLALALGSTLPLSAQTAEKTWFEPMDLFGGPRVGAAVSNLSQLDGSLTLGPSVGVFFEVHFTPRIATSFDMSYTYEGTRDASCNFLSTRNTDQGKKSDIMIHMMNSDYRFRYYLMPNLNLATGLHFSRIIYATGKTDGRNIKIHKHLKRGNLSIPIAAEYSMGPWAVEATYYVPIRGLSGSKTMKDIIGNPKTSLITLTAAYKFQIL